MRIAIMAAGAVGGYFGARLAAAGHEVAFIARGAHLEAIRQNGLKIESPLGDLHLKDAHATDDPAAVGPVDVVLFAVKLWDTEKSAAQAKPLLGPHTRVITLQNGVDSVERLTPILGADAVVGGTAYIATTIGSPGVIVHGGPFAQMRCGRPGNQADPQLKVFVEAARKANIDAVLVDDIERERWEKFVFLVAMSGATGSTRMSLGPIITDPDTRALFHRLMSEVVAVGTKKGVRLAPDFVDARMRFADMAPPTFKASLLHDLERGNRLELDWLAGKVVALGKEVGVATPANEFVYAVLKLHRMGKT